MPLSLLGSAEKGNLFKRLDADSAASLLGPSLEIRDATLFVTSE